MATVSNTLRTHAQNQNLQMNNRAANPGGNRTGGGRPTLRAGIVVSASNNPFAAAPQLDAASSVAVMDQWLSMSPVELLHALLILNADGSYSMSPRALEQFKQMPSNIAADIVAQLANPNVGPADAYFNATILIELGKAAGETDHFSQIFTPENMKNASKLFGNNAEYFAALEQGSSMKDGQMTIYLASDEGPMPIVIDTTGPLATARNLDDGVIALTNDKSNLTPAMALKHAILTDRDSTPRRFPRAAGMDDAQVDAYVTSLLNQASARHADFGRMGQQFSSIMAVSLRSSEVIADQSNSPQSSGTNQRTMNGAGGAGSNGGRTDGARNYSAGAGSTPPNIVGPSFRELHAALIQMLTASENERRGLTQGLLDAQADGAEIDQATLTGFKTDMDAVQGRMDIMSNILKDAGEYQKNLARKIMG